MRNRRLSRHHAVDFQVEMDKEIAGTNANDCSENDVGSKGLPSRPKRHCKPTTSRYEFCYGQHWSSAKIILKPPIPSNESSKVLKRFMDVKQKENKQPIKYEAVRCARSMISASNNKTDEALEISGGFFFH